MQATFIQEGNALDYTPVAAVEPGTVVIQENIAGVVTRDIAAAELGAIQVSGIFDFVHIADVIAVGAAAYWDATGNPYGGEAGTGAATATAGENTFLGWATEAAGVEDAVVRVKMFGSPAITVNHYGPLNNLIADPGASGAIPVTASGRVELVSAGAETRTLAAPTFGGQQMLLGFKTDVGDVVITVTGCDDGNTITFANVGESILLMAAVKDAAFVWRTMADPDTLISTV